jgi:hypothetical protein
MFRARRCSDKLPHYRRRGTRDSCVSPRARLQPHDRTAMSVEDATTTMPLIAIDSGVITALASMTAPISFSDRQFEAILIAAGALPVPGVMPSCAPSPVGCPPSHPMPKFGRPPPVRSASINSPRRIGSAIIAA